MPRASYSTVGSFRIGLADVALVIEDELGRDLHMPPVLREECPHLGILAA
jgi:hypothetical protein